MFKVFFLMSGAGAGAETGPSIFQSFIFIFLIFAIFYFLMIRPQQKKQKEHQQMKTATLIGLPIFRICRCEQAKNYTKM